MKLIRLSILALLFLASCGDSLIPRGKMSRIIADLYVTDRYVFSYHDLMKSADTSKLYEPIINKYGYTTQDFVNTIGYYVERPAKLKTIYANAKLILQAEFASAEAEVARKRSLDSLLVEIEIRFSQSAEAKIEDSHSRAIRWIYFPGKTQKWSSAVPDSIAVRYDAPVSAWWWSNNMKTIQKPFNQYEKNRSTIHPARELQTDPERLPLH